MNIPRCSNSHGLARLPPPIKRLWEAGPVRIPSELHPLLNATSGTLPKASEAQFPHLSGGTVMVEVLTPPPALC